MKKGNVGSYRLQEIKNRSSSVGSVYFNCFKMAQKDLQEHSESQAQQNQQSKAQQSPPFKALKKPAPVTQRKEPILRVHTSKLESIHKRQHSLQQIPESVNKSQRVQLQSSEHFNENASSNPQIKCQDQQNNQKLSSLHSPLSQQSQSHQNFYSQQKIFAQQELKQQVTSQNGGISFKVSQMKLNNNSNIQSQKKKTHKQSKSISQSQVNFKSFVQEGIQGREQDSFKHQINDNQNEIEPIKSANIKQNISTQDLAYQNFRSQRPSIKHLKNNDINPKKNKTGLNFYSNKLSKPTSNQQGGYLIPGNTDLSGIVYLKDSIGNLHKNKDSLVSNIQKNQNYKVPYLEMIEPAYYGSQQLVNLGQSFRRQQLLQDRSLAQLKIQNDLLKNSSLFNKGSNDGLSSSQKIDLEKQIQDQDSVLDQLKKGRLDLYAKQVKGGLKEKIEQQIKSVLQLTTNVLEHSDKTQFDIKDNQEKALPQQTQKIKSGSKQWAKIIDGLTNSLKFSLNDYTEKQKSKIKELENFDQMQLFSTYADKLSLGPHVASQRESQIKNSQNSTHQQLIHSNYYKKQFEEAVKECLQAQEVTRDILGFKNVVVNSMTLIFQKVIDLSNELIESNSSFYNNQFQQNQKIKLLEDMKSDIVGKIYNQKNVNRIKEDQIQQQLEIKIIKLQSDVLGYQNNLNMQIIENETLQQEILDLQEEIQKKNNQIKNLQKDFQGAEHKNNFKQNYIGKVQIMLENIYQGKLEVKEGNKALRKIVTQQIQEIDYYKLLNEQTGNKTDKFREIALMQLEDYQSLSLTHQELFTQVKYFQKNYMIDLKSIKQKKEQNVRNTLGENCTEQLFYTVNEFMERTNPAFIMKEYDQRLNVYDDSLHKYIEEIRTTLYPTQNPFPSQDMYQVKEVATPQIQDKETMENLRIARVPFNFYVGTYLKEHQQNMSKGTFKSKFNIITVIEIIRGMYETRYNEMVAKDSLQHFSSFQTFVYCWLDQYTLQPTSKLIDFAKEEQADSQKADFLLQIASPFYKKLWECTTFLEFMTNKFTNDEIYVYLLMRHKIFQSNILNQNGASVNYINYVDYNSTLQIIEEMIQTNSCREQSLEVQMDTFAKLKIQLEPSIKLLGVNKMKYIDGSFVCRILLQHYRIRKMNQVVALTEVFNNFYKKLNYDEDCFNMKIQMVRRALKLVFPSMPLAQVLNVYNLAYQVGHGVVDIKSLKIALNEEGSFLGGFGFKAFFGSSVNTHLDAKQQTKMDNKIRDNYQRQFKANEETLGLIEKMALRLGMSDEHQQIGKIKRMVESRMFSKVEMKGQWGLTMMLYIYELAARVGRVMIESLGPYYINSYREEVISKNILGGLQEMLKVPLLLIDWYKQDFKVRQESSTVIQNCSLSYLQKYYKMASQILSVRKKNRSKNSMIMLP